MPASDIVIKGAREHNLRNVEVVLPRNKLICLTGVSGSGKSSLAFDTLYAEGQRRYVESLSTFARQFLGQMPKPDVEWISGLSPSISISQKTSGQNPRSTVGTITEIYDYLRVLFARIGQGHCSKCDKPITAQTREQILARILLMPAGTRFLVLAPLVRGQKGEHRDLFESLLKQGFLRARVDGTVFNLDQAPSLDRQMKHDIEVVVDRLVASPDQRTRLAEAVELALRQGQGNLIISPEQAESTVKQRPGKRSADVPEVHEQRFSVHYACVSCGLSFESPDPQLFSFNSPRGMCLTCAGMGIEYGIDPQLLIPNQGKSVMQGGIETLGPWSDLGRWRRHILEGMAETLERIHSLERGTVLETAWEELPEYLQKAVLYGTGNQHITFSWRHGGKDQKYGGRYDGIIPELMSHYKQSKGGPHKKKLDQYMRQVACPECMGLRLNPQARGVRITTASGQFADRPSLSLPNVCQLPVSDAAEFFSELQLDATGHMIAAEVLKEIRGRLSFLVNVGLEYLTLDRTAPTLSGGESQRIRLAGQIGCGLVGVLYVMDEPSIGLHPRDNQRLIHTLGQLRDMGNTVVVVEHDEETMLAADYLVDFGPGPGVRGGEVVASGSPSDLCKAPNSLTGKFLAGKEKIEIPSVRRQPQKNWLRLKGARANNLKNVNVEIPLGLFVCVTGASGSGKSSIVNQTLEEALRRDLNGGDGSPGPYDRIEGLEHLDKMIAIDQSPIGRTPRSNPSTYTKLWDDIRRLYAMHPDAKARGYQEGRFSFNVEGGRCEACEGNGSNRLEMDFLADVWVTCPVCQGQRFNRETLQILFKGKSIAEVLDMDVQQALELFDKVPAVRHKLQTLHDVGLDYVKLGQPSPTLSGGEAQRIKLARELVKRSTGKTLYLLDEPTTGLHFADIRMLLKVLHEFANAGNTVIVVEHNLDVIKTADWVIDVGPEGGAAGGKIIAAGPPEEVARCRDSYTGIALAPLLQVQNGARRAVLPKAEGKGDKHPLSQAIKVIGARQHNLKHVDVEIPRDQITVCCGRSGSGKTSLAMDTIYAEGQRRYVESLSSYARQFVGQMQKPLLEHIEGLSPAIAIEQKHLGHTPRSTVGTVTEIHDYLRILYARLGQPHCPDCEIPVSTQTSDEIVDKLLAHEEGTKLYIMAPIEVAVGEKYDDLWTDLKGRGYARVRVDGATHSLESPPTIDRKRRHAVEVVIDRIVVNPKHRSRVADSVEHALSLGKGVLHVAYVQEDRVEIDWPTKIHSQHLACEKCGRSLERLSPHHFSFNSALGWCSACQGLGTQTGANPAAFVANDSWSLSQGAIAAWPSVESGLFRGMLDALCHESSISATIPFDRLSPREKRLVFHGTQDKWFTVPGTGEGSKKKDRPATPTFRFQYKGLYSAFEEGARLSAGIRGKIELLVGEVECSVCYGSRLRDDASAVRYKNYTLDALSRLPLAELLQQMNSWKLTAAEKKIAGEVLREIKNRVQFLVDVGLDYLTLARSAPTLSGGEAQRIRLASQVGSGLTGVLYVLDEPTIGLHPRDNTRLIQALGKLRDLGNTLLMVEHDKEVLSQADYLLDFGPAAGEQGGEIVARGTPAEIVKQEKSVTGPYLSGSKAIPIPANRRIAAAAVNGDPSKQEPAPSKKGAAAKGAKSRAAKVAESAAEMAPPGGGWLEVIGARHNNLRNISVKIPLGTLTVVSGVSGSGKSSLVEDVLYNALARTLHRASVVPAPHDEIRGINLVNKVIRVDQMPLGQTPTSNPATYTGLFDLIRTLFSQLPESKIRGYTPRRFSFNVPGGRCEKCEGNGQLRIEMHFLPDVWVECDECRGRRYNEESLRVRYKDHSIADVLDLSCGQALALFENLPQVRRVLQTLCDVGLDYLRLGQSAPTLSGGEAQRVKLAAELARPDTGRTLYLLDEPTTGLHFDDLAKLLEVLQRLVDLGNTVVVIEHNLDIIKSADWVIELGPEAGVQGGKIVVSGPPEQVVQHAKNYSARGNASQGNGVLRSHTGEILEQVLKAGPYLPRKRYEPFASNAPKRGELDIADVGRDIKMPWEEDGRRWHTVDRVGRNGEACRWDGRILGAVVDRIHEAGAFSATDWSTRTIVEISGERKSDGWFFHALTGEPWLLKLKFRVARRTFEQEKLSARLSLIPLNELQLPIYGTEQRVSVRQLAGPWQEVELKPYSWEEVDRPEFWTFIDEAVAGFQKFATRAKENPDDFMPWKVLGQKWHFSRKGFPLGKRVQWEPSVLEDLCELLSKVAPKGQFLWNNQQVVHYLLRGKNEPWATIHTKRVSSVDLSLSVPRSKYALGRFASLGINPELQQVDRGEYDLVKLKFQERSQVMDRLLAEFLREQLRDGT